MKQIIYTTALAAVLALIASESRATVQVLEHELDNDDIIYNYCHIDTLEEIDDHCKKYGDGDSDMYSCIELCYCMKDSESYSWKFPWEKKQ